MLERHGQEEDEWGRLGRELLETNPQSYRYLLSMIRELVAAEKRLATPELGTFLELIRTRFVPS